MKAICEKLNPAHRPKEFAASPCSRRFKQGTKGGNVGCRAVSLLSMLALSGIANAQFCPQNFDGVTAPALPAGWTASVLTGATSAWATSTSFPDGSPNKAFAGEPATVTDNVLVSPSTLITAANSTFYFRHYYRMESMNDGGVLEISTDGAAFVDVVTAGGALTFNAYNSTIGSGYGSPIAGRPAWSGNSTDYVTTGVFLPASTMGHNVRVRWRAATDSSIAGGGWSIDSILCGPAQPPPPSPWVLAAPYPVNILDPAVATIAGTLHSFGGYSGQVITPQSYRFDGNAWTRITDLPQALLHPAVAASEDQYIYIVGGFSSNSSIPTTAAYRYHRLTTLYGTIASSPTATVGSAAVYLNGKIYKIGGLVDANSTPTSAVEVYDIASNSWSTVASYPSAQGYVSAFTRDGFIYAAGGMAGQQLVGTLKAYRYDPASNVWNDSALADLPATRWGAASSNFHGTGLIAGGFVGGSGGINASKSAIQWNAQTNTWINLPDMLQARARPGGGVLSGCFFAFGGSSSSGAGAGFTGTTQNQKLDCVFYDGFEK